MSHSPGSHRGPQPPPTDAQHSPFPRGPAGRRRPLLELCGIWGTTALPSSAFAPPNLRPNQSQQMSYYVHTTRARARARPRTPNPCGQTSTRPAPVIISCKAKQLGVSALLSLPSPFLFTVLGKKRLIKLRKYPFSPPS